MPNGPADLVAALPWSAILEPLDWQFVRMIDVPPRGRAEQWRRPGSTSAHSGNFWECYGAIHRDYAGTALTLVALRKFTIYAELYYQGDTAAAGRAVWETTVARWGVAR